MSEFSRDPPSQVAARERGWADDNVYRPVTTSGDTDDSPGCGNAVSLSGNVVMDIAIHSRCSSLPAVLHERAGWSPPALAPFGILAAARLVASSVGPVVLPTPTSREGCANRCKRKDLPQLIQSVLERNGFVKMARGSRGSKELARRCLSTCTGSTDHIIDPARNCPWEQISQRSVMRALAAGTPRRSWLPRADAARIEMN